jgi:murein DD-endopeptidase MepM/ murein hydrolase activator NlpD
MKKVLLSLSLLLLVSTTFAQSDKYKSAMEQNLQLLNTAKTKAELQAAAAAFERVANAEKTQWLPYYYASLANIWIGFAAPKEESDQVATQAETLLAKAEALAPKQAEIFIAKNMIATIHMLVDPQARWQTYGGAAAQALQTAKALDEANPRIYFLEGQSLFGTPEQFGGGKEKAKVAFQKSLTLFDTYKPADELSPNWGKQQAADMLAKCN